MDNLRLWHKFLEAIKSEIGGANLKTYFIKTLLKSVNDDVVTLNTPSAFIKENLDKKYKALIEATFTKILGKPVTVEFLVKETQQSSQDVEDDGFFQPTRAQAPQLNPKFTLENFVVGPTNNVAFAAAQAVAQNPGTSYNPLFIYGGTGVGKTHLMLAIGNAILAKKPHAKIIYSPSEKFMNDFVEALRTNKMGDLRNKYRSPDLLLIDDIQFFSGREGTQEEFFHTFNELIGKNSQIVLTSDRSPNEIAKIEDRLKSRFAGGLMLDIQPPDFDTRVAILRAKCKEQQVAISEEALQMLASSFNTNIRELEGKLVGILQMLKVQNLPPTTENISMHLKLPLKQNLKLDPKAVLEIVCDYFNLNQKDLIGAKRQKELVLPRHITMFILSEHLNMTVEKIGQILGKRDHTTVMHGRDKIKGLMNTDIEVQKYMTEIKSRLRA